MRRIPLAPSFVLGMFSLASLSGSASAGIIAIGGTARPGFDLHREISTLEIPYSTYRRLAARLSYQRGEAIEIFISGRYLFVKMKGDCLVDSAETLLLLPLAD